VVLRIGYRYNTSCEPLQLAGEKLKFVVSLKHLCICIKAITHFKCLIEHLKLKFYGVFNCIFSRSKGANSELTTVELLKSYCLPFLLYGFDAVTLSDANARVLDGCLDRDVYRIFGVCDKDNVSCLRTLLGLHSISNFVKNKCVKLLDGLLDTGSATLIIIYLLHQKVAKKCKHKTHTKYNTSI